MRKISILKGLRTHSGTSRTSSIGVDSDKALQFRVQLLYTLIAFLHFQCDLRRRVRFDFGEFFVELRDVGPKLRSFVPKLQCLVPKLAMLVPELSHFTVQSRDVDGELGGLFPEPKESPGRWVSADSEETPSRDGSGIRQLGASPAVRLQGAYR